ncbi:MAG: hypothetical protein ABIR71_01190 [Chthoniobacterales bacterium]
MSPIIAVIVIFLALGMMLGWFLRRRIVRAYALASFIPIAMQVVTDFCLKFDPARFQKPLMSILRESAGGLQLDIAIGMIYGVLPAVIGVSLVWLGQSKRIANGVASKRGQS